ncbi:hypothetical protein LINGRAHAP2_LOCUS14456 [Linum grandiflorum]
MKAHLENIDFDLWDIMNEDFSEIKAKRSDWSAEEMKKMQLNANAINIFYYSLAEDEFNRISNCTTANEIWKPLQVTHEDDQKIQAHMALTDGESSDAENQEEKLHSEEMEMEELLVKEQLDTNQKRTSIRFQRHQMELNRRSDEGDMVVSSWEMSC